MLAFRDITLQRGKKVLLDHASAVLECGNRIGLVGRNGAGKSTLMSVITGALQEDGGALQCDIHRDRMATLEQSLPDATLCVIEFVKTGDRDWALLNVALQQAEANEDGVKIAEYHARLQDIDGYTIDARAAKILHGLGFQDADFKKQVGDFSGGWQMRLQLAKVLLSRADLLLLDEPTNHLDLEAIAWFEQWLLSQTCSVILISHDREFLDNVCTQILHLSQQKLKLYSGNYSAFIKQFELQLEVQSREREKVERQKAHMQKYVDRFRYKASKAKQAQSRMKAIEKLTIAPGVQQENPFHFSFMPCQTLSSPVLKIEGDAGYPEKTVLMRLNASLQANDRIALLGLNGAGKSTLVKTLSGVLPLLHGDVTKHGKLKIGYYSQQQLDALDYDSTPLAHLLKQHPALSESEARRFLGGFNFIGDRVFDHVGNFSGGEKARLALALLIRQAPNMLLLDEPTNHLDIQMREALIFALQAYDGVLVLVSHDRHFVNSVVDQLWLVSNGTVTQFKGNLEDYQQSVLSAEASSPSVSVNVPKKPKKTSNTKSANPQKLRLLEKEIARLSSEKQALALQLSDPALYQLDQSAHREALQSDFDRVCQALEIAEEEWLFRSDAHD